MNTNHAPFPLTLTRSLGEREKQPDATRFSNGLPTNPALSFPAGRKTILPLPEGEGRGEGERVN